MILGTVFQESSFLFFCIKHTEGTWTKFSVLVKSKNLNAVRGDEEYGKSGEEQHAVVRLVLTRIYMWVNTITERKTLSGWQKVIQKRFKENQILNTNYLKSNIVA